ncbi:MAG: LapA family protein [Pseudorhodobacter sp.]
MMRYLRYLFYLVLAVVLLTVALGNRTPTTVHVMPEDMSAFLGFQWSATLPLYLIIFGGIVVGLMIGFVLEWFREHKHRASASNRAKQVANLERELSELRSQSDHKDDVVALLETSAKAG